MHSPGLKNFRLLQSKGSIVYTRACETLHSQANSVYTATRYFFNNNLSITHPSKAMLIVGRLQSTEFHVANSTYGAPHQAKFSILLLHYTIRP